MSERKLMAAILLSGLMVAKPESLDDPIKMGELVTKAFNIADAMGADK